MLLRPHRYQQDRVWPPCANDGNYIPRLEQGRTPSLLTIDKVRKYIAQRSRAAKPWKAS